MAPRVLIGDHDAAVRRRAVRVLERSGRFAVCATAADAAETIAAALAERPDLCLIEPALPGGGLAAAWEITSRLPVTNVVILAARENDDELLEAVGIGVSGYLVKDAELEWLPKALLDVHRGSFAIPRRLTRKVVQQLRTSAPRRRVIVGSSTRLTSREWEVMDLIARGLSTRQVAEHLTLSPTAVRVHIAAAVRKLDAGSREQAIDAFRRTSVQDAERTASFGS
jgi:DNA-binding NarL/FixJ family response regulator